MECHWGNGESWELRKYFVEEISEADQRLICPQHSAVWLKSLNVSRVQWNMCVLHAATEIQPHLFHGAATHWVMKMKVYWKTPLASRHLRILDKESSVTGNSDSGSQTEPQDTESQILNRDRAVLREAFV